MSRPQSILAVSLALASLAACGGGARTKETPAQPGGAPAEAPAEAPRPWTRQFAEAAVLTARSVEIVGPKGLIEHLVVTQDAENHTHSVTAVRQGLRIQAGQKPGGDGSPIIAQLDNLRIAADASLVALESVSAEQVVISADGDVYWFVVATGAEKRAASLRIVGEAPR